MKGASIEAQKYATNIKEGTGSAQTFATNQRTIQASMSETSIVSKVAATGLSIFKAALNSLIFFAVIEGIQLLIKGIDNLILTADEAEEKAEALRGNMQSFFDEVQSGQQTISSVSDRFSELSKHVTKTGENIDLTKDEYSEYLDICNQVKTIMPELVTGYTNEGNAIITLKGNVDSLTESYKENIRTKASAFITNGDDDGNTIQSFFDDYKIFTEGENGLFAPSANGLWNNKSTDYEDYYGYNKVHEWLEDVVDLSLKDLQNLQKGTTQATYLYALLKENGYELANITEDNYEAVHDVLDTRLTSLEGEMTTRVSNVKMSLQQMLYADRDYWDIDDKEALSAIDSMFSSIDSEFIKQNNLLGQDALQSFESNVIKLFEDKDTQKAMSDIYTPQGEDESIKDYSKRVNDAIKEVQKYIKDNNLDISLDFGTDKNPKGIKESVDKLEDSYDQVINRFSNHATEKQTKALESAKQNLQDEYDKITGENGQPDFELGDYAEQIKNKTIQTVFGNVDMDKRTIIHWSDELKKTYADALASWDYDPKVGTIDTVYGMSDRFGEGFKGHEEGWEVAFTPILPDGTFLSKDTVSEYINQILTEAYADDGKVTEDELTAIDAQGRQVGDTFVKGIFAGVDDSQNYDDNGNWAETVGRLMHFSGYDGAIQIAERKISDLEKRFGKDGSQTIADFFSTEGINTQDEIDAFNDVTKGINDADKAIQTWNEHKKEANEDSFELPDTETLQKQISDLNSAIDSIQSAYDTLYSAVEEYNSNGGQLSIDTIQSLLSLSDDYLACLQLENGQLSLNTDAMAQLAQAKLDDAQATAVTQAMTELQAIANGEAAQSTTSYIAGNAALMNSLAQLSGSYDGVAQAAMTAAQAQALSAQISSASAKDKTATEKVMKGLDAKLKLIQTTKKSISAGNFGTVAKKKSSSGSGSKKSGSGGKNSGSDAEKQNEEYLDKFMAYQKARLEAGKITYQQYSQYVSDELERMYKNGEISASKYYSAIKNMIDEQKSIYDAALKGVTKLLDDEVQKWQDKIDAIEKTNDKLNEQKDKYDSILSAIQKVYDDEIEDANKRKDSIQDVIDAMSDENDEYERQKKLQEAIYNLNKANSQKTKYLLKDGQFVYSTDNSAIRDAQDSLHDAQYDVDVANLKKQQDDIDNYIDTLNEFKDKWSEISDAFSEAQDTMNLKQYLGSEYQRIILSNNLADIENFKNQYVNIESQINSNEQLKTSYEEKVDYYNNLKQQWADCTSKYDDEMNKLYASQVLGANWESEVLNGRLQTLTNFTSEYEKLCQRRADAAVNAANVEVQASKNAAAGVTSTSSSVASSGGGSSSGGSSSSSSTSSTPKVTYDKNNNPNKPAQKSKDYWTYEKLSSGYSTSGQASSHISDYASKGANGFTQIGNKYFVVKWIANAGTPANASKAKSKLEKDNPKKIGKYGYAKRYHKGLELGKIDALPKDKAFDLVQDVGINGLKSDEVPIIAQKREAVITEEQIENLAKTLHLVPVQNEIMEKMSKINLGDLPMNTPKMNFDASKIGQNVTRNNFAPNVNITFNCPNLTNESGVQYVEKAMDKYMNKFANDFYQASLHYVNKK